MQSSAHYNTHSDHIPLSYLIKYLISVITGTLDLIVIIIITLVHFIYLLFIRSFPDFVTVFYEGPLSATLGATRAPSPKLLVQKMYSRYCAINHPFSQTRHTKWKADNCLRERSLPIYPSRRVHHWLLSAYHFYYCPF